MGNKQVGHKANRNLKVRRKRSYKHTKSSENSKTNKYRKHTSGSKLPLPQNQSWPIVPPPSSSPPPICSCSTCWSSSLVATFGPSIPLTNSSEQVNSRDGGGFVRARGNALLLMQRPGKGFDAAGFVGRKGNVNIVGHRR